MKADAAVEAKSNNATRRAIVGRPKPSAGSYFSSGSATFESVPTDFGGVGSTHPSFERLRPVSAGDRLSV